MPKTCWLFRLMSLIWNRGSWVLSVETSRSNRPSSGEGLLSGPYVTMNLGRGASEEPAAPAKAAAEMTIDERTRVNRRCGIRTSCSCRKHTGSPAASA